MTDRPRPGMPRTSPAGLRDRRSSVSVVTFRHSEGMGTTWLQNRRLQARSNRMISRQSIAAGSPSAIGHSSGGRSATAESPTPGWSRSSPRFVLAFLIYRGLDAEPVVAGRSGRRLRRTGPVSRADPAGRRSGPPGRRLLFQGTGAAGGPVGRPGSARARVSRPRAPVCRRSRPVRRGLALRAIVHGPDAGRRGDAGLVAAGTGQPRRRSGSDTRRSPSCVPGSTCARTSSSWASRSAAGIDPAALAAWGRATASFRARRSLSSRRSWECSAPPHLSAGCSWRYEPCPSAAGPCRSTAVFARIVSGRVRTVLAAVDRRTHDLVLLSELLRRLERETFESPLLQRLVKSLETDGLAASAQIRRLARLLHLLDYKRNQLFMPLAAIWLWTIQLALRIDAWRARIGPQNRPLAEGDR